MEENCWIFLVFQILHRNLSVNKYSVIYINMYINADCRYMYENNNI